MSASVVLYRGIEKTLNSRDRSGSSSEIDNMKNIIGDLFIKSCFMLPKDLLEDLYQFYLDFGDPVIDSDSLRELAYHLVDVIDLFDMDYDDVKDPIKLDEWKTIKNLVSSYAADIDDELLIYIMQFALEKGAFR